MKSIRFNAVSAGDAEEFGAEDNFTLHTNGVTVYFDRVKESPAGYTFVRYDAEIAFVSEDDCDVSPEAAKRAAADSPGEKIPFADE